jgi:hypothetical protein
MIRKLIVTATLAALALASPAFAQEARYSITKQTIGELVKNDATKAVLLKHIPEVVANPQLEQGYTMKFADIVQYAPEQLTPEKLKAIEEDLAKIP